MNWSELLDDIDFPANKHTAAWAKGKGIEKLTDMRDALKRLMECNKNSSRNYESALYMHKRYISDYNAVVFELTRRGLDTN